MQSTAPWWAPGLAEVHQEADSALGAAGRRCGAPQDGLVEDEVRCGWAWPRISMLSPKGNRICQAPNNIIYKLYIESILIPVTVKKRDFHIGTPKRCTKQIVFLGNWQSGT